MTPNLSLVFLDVGQKEKETTINSNMTLIDTAVKANQDAIEDLEESVDAKPVALADAATNPATTGLIPGTTYYNTSDNKVYWLRPNLTWVALT